MTDDEVPIIRTDPVLRLLPGDLPAAFVRLPPGEQRWRGRVFAMILTSTGGTGGRNTAYAWWQALRSDDDDEATRAYVATVPDGQIIEALEALWGGSVRPDGEAPGG